MDRRRFTLGCGCCGFLVSLSAHCWEMPSRFARPDITTDEGGLWAMMDREEARLKRSRFLLEDQDLQNYVSSIACRLAGDHCPDIRPYLIRSPFFNASMAPNGMLQLWSGLLLRITNEAQLAAIIGHEVGHYVAKHSLAQFRDAKSKAAFGQFFGMFLGAAGAGGAAVGLLGQLALVASMFAYSREHEIQADEIGLELMARAGYAPLEAPRVWKNLTEEAKADPDGDTSAGSILFATHPAPKDRLEQLATLASTMPAEGLLGESTFSKVIQPIKRSLLQDEMKLRRPSETLVLLDRLLENNPADGQLMYFKGEAFRLRNGKNDTERAFESYEASIRTGTAPSETYRSLGLLEQKRGNRESAHQYFRTYLDKKPDAEDAELIRSYVNEDS